MPYRVCSIMVFGWMCTVLSALGQNSNFDIRVELRDSQMIVADARYAGPLTNVWEVLRAPQNFPKFYPRILSAEFVGLLKGDEQYFVKVQTPVWLPNMWNMLSISYNEALHQASWKKREGNLVDHHGFITVKDDKGQSQVHLEVTVKALGLLPSSSVSASTKVQVRKFLQSFGEHLQSLPKPKP